MKYQQKFLFKEKKRIKAQVVNVEFADLLKKVIHA